MKNTNHLKVWRRNRAVVECDPESHDTVPSVGNLLLPFSPTMALNHYLFYQAEGEFPGLVSQYLNVLTAGLLRKPPRVDGDLPAISLTPLFKDGVLEHLMTGSGYVWVDEGSISILAAESVIEWSAAGDVCIIEVSVEAWEGVNSKCANYRYEYTKPGGVVHVKRIVDGTTEIDTDLIINGTPLQTIPVFPLTGTWRTPITPSIVQPLIDREIGLYNKLSRRNHLLYGAATYTPVVSSDMSEQEFGNIVKRGIGSWIKVAKGETVTVMSAPTEALAGMERAIESTVNDMARMGIRILAPDGGGSSGVALEIRNSSQTAQLGLLNERVSATLGRVCRLMLMWQGVAENVDVDVQLSADFNPTPMGADWMRLITEWYTGGQIPRSLWLDIGRTNDVIPADYDDDLGKAEIAADPLVSIKSGAQVNI